MQTTHYDIYSNKVQSKIALVSDLHNGPYSMVIDSIKENRPDIIACSGDFSNAKTGGYKNSLTFFDEAAKIAPVFFSIGNHDRYIGTPFYKALKTAPVVFLDNSYIEYGGMLIGGLSPDITVGWLESFASQKGFKLLLSHFPERYVQFIKKYDIDLILSGHAHGGQFRFFGQGIFAPGQGFMPKYTSGSFDNRLVIGRGLANIYKIPRLFNEPEMVYINVKKIKNVTCHF